MAKVKYAAAVIPLLNKHFGAIFQPNHTNQTMKSDYAGARTRWTRQTQKQQGLMKAVRMWRNMSVATKTNWNTFASTYPQASRRNPAIFLTGYQLFLKRNHYCFLNHGIDCDFMEEPTLEELPEPDFSFSIEDSNNVLDVTELYISNFGIIPVPGQFVLIRVFSMAENSGQFFEPIEQIIEVTESYIDGLFVSLSFASDVRNLTFSVYLSKVFHQSINYVGTKVRYMGCFTPKTFLALTDTPDSYAGEAEKQVAVKADESGLEFIAGGGGGISCEDLIDCPLIIQMIEQIEAISIGVIPLINVSIPSIKLGLLYNFPVTKSALGILNSGFVVPHFSDKQTLFAFLGGQSIAGGKMKEIGLVYFDSPNTGASNSSGFNARGTGYRTAAGSFQNIMKTFQFSDSYDSGSASITFGSCNWNSAAAGGSISRNYKEGVPLRGFKSPSDLNDGEIGTYIGNNGQIYRTICIGTQEWIADNLVETKFNDGTEIPEIQDSSEWAALTTPALCAYDNDWDNV